MRCFTGFEVSYPVRGELLPTLSCGVRAGWHQALAGFFDGIAADLLFLFAGMLLRG